MLQRKEITDNVIELFMDEVGYKHNDRFSNSNSPYYGNRQWHMSTDDPTEVFMIYENDEFIVKFCYRDINTETAISTSKSFLDKHNFKYTSQIRTEDIEKDWFYVFIQLNTQDVLNRYRLYEDWLDVDLIDYDKLLLEFECIAYKANLVYANDLDQSNDTIAKFGNEQDHITICMGKKDSLYFGQLYVTVNNTEVYQSKHYLANSMTQVIVHLQNELKNIQHEYNDTISNCISDLLAVM